MKLTSIIPIIGMALSAAAYTGCVNASAETELDIDGDLAYCNAQIHRTLDGLRGNSDTIDYTMMPRNMEGDATCWHCRKADKEEWCGGFWPGILWYNYEATGDTTIRKEAEKFTSSLEFLSKIPAFDHDLGFLMFCSYGNGYRLTRDPHYRQVIIDTADSLATLYNPNVGTILSWPRNVKMLGGHNTIMDNMINLEMLFWAAKNGGGSNLYDIAVKHAETTMKHHFRPDFTCYHVAVYDSVSGDFIKGMTHQGYADNSLWARGQSWAIYGYTMVYRETRDPRFLDFAQKVTDVYLDRLPEDYVPYWDFDDPRIPDAPRDASAAAVVASALLELQGYVQPEQSKKYLAAAEKMLASLGSDAYRSGDRRPAFLDHSVGHHPAGSEIDAAIIYADYYYIEALLRKKKLEEKHDVLATL
ncbi:MAG TPA: glucuronyl hydrolase [Porphyromonadaceae bacterium]|nr:glucuronyl hydrolase [Porphyromonadaceae bacterium]